MPTGVLISRDGSVSSLVFIGDTTDQSSIDATSTRIDVDSAGDLVLIPFSGGKSYIQDLTLGGLAANRILVTDSAGLAGVLAPGTNGYVLTVVGGVPTWQPASSGVGTTSDVLIDGGDFTAVSNSVLVDAGTF